MSLLPRGRFNMKTEALEQRYYKWATLRIQKGDEPWYTRIRNQFCPPGATLLICMQVNGCSSNCGSLATHLWETTDNLADERVAVSELSVVRDALSEFGATKMARVVDTFKTRLPQLWPLLKRWNRDDAACEKLQQYVKEIDAAGSENEDWFSKRTSDYAESHRGNLEAEMRTYRK